ncbi:serine/threonine-protein kinase gin4, partial [Cryomyces antarcticus]
MLTGTTPFNYTEDKDLKQMFKAIARAEYFMPPQLSNEAQDLLRRIFVPDPARRISMEAIWRHPFMHKYNADFNFEGEGSKLENWIGPQPRLEDWTVKRRQEIDAEILGNMRTLWHSVREEILIQRLLNQEPNQEKYFYATLVKHRDEHLENYIASPSSVGYSASDYHHIKPAAVSRKQHPSPDRAERSKSGFSIMNDEHLGSSNSFHEPPPSVSSYDPFRASRDPIVAMPRNYMNVTVHRGKSSRKGKSVTSNSLRQPSSLRIEILKKRNGQDSAAS